MGLLFFANTFVKKYSLEFYLDSSTDSENIKNENKEEQNQGKIEAGELSNKTEENNNLADSNEIEKEENKVEIIKITSANFEQEVIKSEGTILIDFYADWCGPCKMMSPVIDKIAEENPDIKVGKINIDEEEALAIQFRVMSIPTFMIIKDGKIVNQIVGMVSKSELEEALK